MRLGRNDGGGRVVNKNWAIRALCFRGGLRLRGAKFGTRMYLIFRQLLLSEVCIARGRLLLHGVVFGCFCLPFTHCSNSFFSSLLRKARSPPSFAQHKYPGWETFSLSFNNYFHPRASSPIRNSHIRSPIQYAQKPLRSFSIILALE